LGKPFVSVLIDTYNHERFIEQAIVSVLEQDFPASEREILVVDDGSTDRTPEIVRKFASQVRLLHKKNGGQASAFNAGIPECKGEVIAFLDGDDWWAQKKLGCLAHIMSLDSMVGMVGHAIIESHREGQELFISPDVTGRLRLNSEHAAKVFRLHRAYLGTSRLALRRSVALAVLPVPEGLIIEADEYLFTLAAALADFFILKDALTYYRIHGGNLFVAGGASAGGLKRKQESLAVLSSSLGPGLRKAGAPEPVIACVLELVWAEADQLRLMTCGGKPWETYKTEAKIYRIQHGNASAGQKLFHELAMIPSLVLPPKTFYAVRHWLAGQSWYRKGRAEFLPAPGFTKIDRLA